MNDTPIAPAKPNRFRRAASSTPAEWTASERQRQKAVLAGHAVVANKKSDAALIAWAKETGLYVHIGRPSYWGNPFVIGVDGDREAVLESHRVYLSHEQGLLGKLEELRGKVLGCFCHPEPCHGDEIIKLLHETGPDHEHDAH